MENMKNPAGAQTIQRSRFSMPLLALLLVTMTLSAADSIHDFTVRTIDGKDQPLSAYKGQAVLIVNVASR